MKNSIVHLSVEIPKDLTITNPLTKMTKLTNLLFVNPSVVVGDGEKAHNRDSFLNCV